MRIAAASEKSQHSLSATGFGFSYLIWSQPEQQFTLFSPGMLALLCTLVLTGQSDHQSSTTSQTAFVNTFRLLSLEPKTVSCSQSVQHHLVFPSLSFHVCPSLHCDCLVFARYIVQGLAAASFRSTSWHHGEQSTMQPDGTASQARLTGAFQKAQDRCGSSSCRARRGQAILNSAKKRYITRVTLEAATCNQCRCQYSAFHCSQCTLWVRPAFIKCGHSEGERSHAQGRC